MDQFQGTRPSQARQSAKKADAIVTMAHWAMAAHATENVIDRVQAMAKALEAAELAFHQAVWRANASGYPWRELAEYTEIPWETLYRKYHDRPEKMPVRRSAYQL
ncbi:MAG TPA: hypothetical protein VMU77_00890 [Acidimicrobiales bacterium]|nr:hypothetical protein [Acidimicrobiales bacterium]